MRVLRVLARFVVVYALITVSGVMAAPLLLILAAHTIVAVLIIRGCLALDPRRQHTTRATLTWDSRRKELKPFAPGTLSLMSENGWHEIAKWRRAFQSEKSFLAWIHPPWIFALVSLSG